jgi:RNA polymerase sigma-70 factor (ECF subfamily)
LKVFISLTGAGEDDSDIDMTASIADEFSVEEFVIDDILLENARKLIKTKPEDVRKVFYLMYNVGLTIPEIAQSLSMSESNVKNKLYRTIKELRDTLNPKDNA